MIKTMSYVLSVPSDATQGSVTLSLDFQNACRGNFENTKVIVQLFNGSTAISSEVTMAELYNTGTWVHKTVNQTISFNASGTITIKLTIIEGLHEADGISFCSNGSLTLTSYSFNTTADVPLASGNAFFLCTDQHNSPYTISDS